MKTFPSPLIQLLFHLNFPTFLDTFLPFEPTLFPKLQVYFADFPYLCYATQPEAINLEDLMRLSVRDGLKMKKQSRSTTSLQLHNSALFSSTTHYFSGNSSDTQLSEVSIVQGLLPALRLPLKEIKKKPISYSSKERQVFASLIKSNSAVSVLAQPHCCNCATFAFIQKRKLCIGSLLPS